MKRNVGQSQSAYLHGFHKGGGKAFGEAKIPQLFAQITRVSQLNRNRLDLLNRLIYKSLRQFSSRSLPLALSLHQP